MAADDSLLLRPVRLVVVTDWDAGFQLQPHVEPLPDVAPGGEYVVDCVPQQAVLIQEVLVRDFALVQISTATQTIKVSPVERGALPRLYRLGTSVVAHSDECISVRLRNDGAVTLKQKVPSLLRVHAAAARIDPAPTGRAEDAVPCPACGKESGDSCDGPASHPSRLMLHVERAAARTEQPSIVAADLVEDMRGPMSRCPTCDSPVRADRRQLVGAGGARPYCKDAWHDGPVIHVPQIVPTPVEGRGNAMLVRGCSCGAEIPSIAAFAGHVGVPEDAVRAIVALAEIAYDLLDRPKKRLRTDARRQIARCLEFVR